MRLRLEERLKAPNNKKALGNQSLNTEPNSQGLIKKIAQKKIGR
jgi:hypothetical protein